MSKVYVMLQKFGDLISILPLCYDDFVKTGEKSILMVHEDYKSILVGTTYVTPLVWSGDANDIAGAVKEGKKHGEVIIPQVVGRNVKDIVYDKSTPKLDSFERQAWYAAGRIRDWKLNLPLVFDNRNPEREKKLIPELQKKKTIIVSTSGVSSPFAYKELLLELLTLKFNRSCNIIDISEVRGEKIYDLLGLLEKATCLVATDSSVLHLARALPLPVIALIADQPSLWHGSAYRPNHLSHIRYSQFPKYIVPALNSILNIGSPGSLWNPSLVNNKRIIHIYYGKPKYPESNKVVYESNTWVESKVPHGALSRFSDNIPYLKDILRLGALRARENDLICLTLPSTKLSPSLTTTLLTNVTDSTPAASPNLWSTTRSWLNQNINQLPDLPYKESSQAFRELTKESIQI